MTVETEVATERGARRFFVEGIVIVASILLAFWIEAWWAGLGEARDERESLELVSRDLTGAIEQLEDFSVFIEGHTDAAFDVYEALTRPEGITDRRVVSDRLMRVLDRRTVVLPKAAYTDLLSTGTLRLIENRNLRDAIVRFYEEAERVETIFARNNAVFADGYIFGLVEDGLVQYRPVGDRGTPASTAVTEELAARFPDDFDYGLDYFWSRPQSSREWHQIRSRLLFSSSALLTSREYAQQLVGSATALRERVDAELGSR